ncbi:MAG: hypothetical protein A3C50_03180 [Candidatus Staskawiczbacteria bacterium RIFCSPHIGHO2_02_FULL_43_16]|uniref:Uncharacterized protein n=1 Tax=Candidatus Staskawiczbacteria bacterium RIFCSPHIGHO2_01_FULL_41_41 TaxID=1802203 RepID=A0A1G2HUC1_9BACT|nr:MAG: hypothetical protein A2822_03050 [Candidatus Staskawiczbacteria bacterium RIFCSPHIGHO2_01_FULL_41_41]OGZ68704.1 MAG: hypothetical protein A3C50_03180 [Candidatus Staskawiczbacteria bacterium RIFCSPHIGHO2_02_FULL_43_16]OGZ75167.1 MAG: hypothetical protein A3A12_01105 [Candidatus Staskawiczbacteria bacterium RIFCSPLOWO2_01_FULL_43_17b]
MTRKVFFILLVAGSFLGSYGITQWWWGQADKTSAVKQDDKVQEVKKPSPQKTTFCDPVQGLTGKIKAKELAQVVPGRFEINLTEFYFTDEELNRMAEVDFRHRGKFENFSHETKTSAGTFCYTSCFGRYSINASAKHDIVTDRFDALKLPNGKWAKLKLGSWLSEVVEKDGHVFLICQNHIFKYVKECKLECVMAGPADNWSIYRAWESRDYLWVQKPSSCDFGGLLLYSDGRWVFHQYKGKYGNRLEKVEAKDGILKLYLLDGWDKHSKHILLPCIEFDPKKGIFSDL